MLTASMASSTGSAFSTFSSPSTNFSDASSCALSHFSVYFAAVLARVAEVRNFLNTPPPLAHATISSVWSLFNGA